MVESTASYGVDNQSFSDDTSNCSKKIEKTDPKQLYNCIQLSPPITLSPPPSTSAPNVVNSPIIPHQTSPRSMSDKITNSSSYPQSKNGNGRSSSQLIKIDTKNKLEDNPSNPYFDKQSDPSMYAGEISIDCTSNKVVTSSGICSKSVPLIGLLLKTCDAVHKGNDQLNKATGSRNRFSPRKHISSEPQSNNKGIQKQPRLVLKLSQIGNHWLKTVPSEKSHKCQRSKKGSKQTQVKIIEFLRNSLDISCQENIGSLSTEVTTKLFVRNNLFQDLFSEMTMDTKCLLESLTMERSPSSIQNNMDPCFSHFIFKNWTVTHISLEAALRLCSFFIVHDCRREDTQKDGAISSILTFISKTLNQIRRKPKIHIKRLQECKIGKDRQKIVSTEHNEDRKMGEKTKEFILENKWRFHGKLKQSYRHFIRQDSSRAYKIFTNCASTTFKNRLHLNANGKQTTSRMFRSSKCGTVDKNYDFGLHLKDSHAVMFKNVKVNEFVQRQSSANVPSPSPEFTTDLSSVVPSRQTMHGGNKFLTEKISPPNQLKNNVRSPLISTSSKSHFKVPQATNTKPKRRRLQDISSLDEITTSDECDDDHEENGDLLEPKCLDPRLLLTPYEPSAKKEVLARASVPGIPKKDSHQISEINIASRQNYNKRKVAFSTAKDKSKQSENFLQILKNCENTSSATPRQKKKDNAILSDEAQNDMFNDDTNNTTNTNNTATVNSEKAAKKVVKMIDMPTFILAEIVKNKPRELEGWVTNNTFQMKKISSEPTTNNDSSSSFPD